MYIFHAVKLITRLNRERRFCPPPPTHTHTHPHSHTHTNTQVCHNESTKCVIVRSWRKSEQPPTPVGENLKGQGNFYNNLSIAVNVSTCWTCIWYFTAIWKTHFALYCCNVLLFCLPLLLLRERGSASTESYLATSLSVLLDTFEHFCHLRSKSSKA